jgi:hypothetical protein
MSAAETLEAGTGGAAAPAGVPWRDLGACGACGGPVRVAVVDLESGTAAIECMACGVRRIEGGDPAPDRSQPAAG